MRDVDEKLDGLEEFIKLVLHQGHWTFTNDARKALEVVEDLRATLPRANSGPWLRDVRYPLKHDRTDSK